MTNSQNLYRLLPGIDELLGDGKFGLLMERFARDVVIHAARIELDAIRIEIAAGKHSMEDLQQRIYRLSEAVEQRVQESLRPSLRRVINATGVILHTNLGRAPLSGAALAHIQEIAAGYSNLEMNLASGERSQRDQHAEGLLLRLLAVRTGVSDLENRYGATVVNNCAAATFLALNSLAESGEVIVSRGELVEIGGGFRVPDILRKSGTELREVGTTNRTRLADYDGAITERTKLILRVHQSNFSMEGFTEKTSLQDLVALGAKRSILVFEDQGTGCILPLSEVGVQEESSLIASIRTGVDLIAISGDKLLGGPQAGILIGKKELIRKIRANPLMRAMRVDKLTYAALEMTLIEYLRSGGSELPIAKMLGGSLEELRERCRALTQAVDSETLKATVVETVSVIGGGTTPGASLRSFAAALERKSMGCLELAAALRRLETPVIGRVNDHRVLLDLRTVFPEEDQILIAALKRMR